MFVFAVFYRVFFLLIDELASDILESFPLLDYNPPLFVVEHAV